VSKLKLNLGCGDRYFMDGFINIDYPTPDIIFMNDNPFNPNVCTSSQPYAGRGEKAKGGLNGSVCSTLTIVDQAFDILKIREHFAPNSVDEVWMLQVLEHFSKEKIAFLLSEIYEILAKNGEFVVTVPDILEAAESLITADRLGDEITLDFCFRHIYGSQKNDQAFHLWGFTERRLKELLHVIGFSKIYSFPNPHFYPAISLKAIK
jgi:SAM-dependent methyltransferase